MPNEKKLLDQLESCDAARLIPTLPDSKREDKATSILLSVFRVFPKFALDILKEVGASAGKRVKINFLTEVVPKHQKGAKLSPNGLICVETTRSTWSAIVESKVGRNQLDPKQIESYVGLARKLQCDAVNTNLNQLSALPTHHPVTVPKNKLGK